MKRKLLIVFVILCPLFSMAVTKTWNGSVSSSWIVANNWTPNAVPVIGVDDIVFDGASTAVVTITDVPAFTSAQSFGFFSAINNVTVTLSSASPTYLLFSTSLSIQAGSRVNIGAATTTLFVFGGNTVTAATTTIDGTLDLQGTGVANQKSYYVYNGATTNAVAKVNGKIILSGSFATITNANNTNLSFENGASLDITRDGGVVPAANFKDGSTITVSGVVSSSTTLNSSAIYQGLIIWDCAGQTTSGGSAILLPAANSSIDSLRVNNTGTGTLRLTTAPNGYSIGQLEVRGGTLEMGAPTASNGTGTIQTDFKITGGTVIGNATYTGDLATAYSVSITVNGYVTITGGTFNLTNRPIALSPGGAFQLYATSNVAQTGGTITATSAFGSQNQINMSGIISQNLELDNITGPIGVEINNTQGVSLQNNMVLTTPTALVLFSGYLQLNNFTASVQYPSLVALANTKVVTNAAGSLTVTGMPAASSVIFPVAPTTTTYNPVTIAPQAGAIANDYSVRVETGNSPGGIYNVTRTVNRTWYITPTTNITSNSVNLSFQYAAADVNASCIATALMELGHFIPGAPGAWNIDPSGSVLPTGANPYVAGPYAPGSLGSSFVLGNVGAILAFEKTIALTAQKLNNTAHLNWSINNTDGVKQITLERSADGRNFDQLAVISTGNSFDDTQLMGGLNYYRIKVINNNGKVSYSTMVAVLNKDAGFEIVGLMPNVVTNNATLQVTAAQKTKMNVLITDAAGRQVQKMVYNVVAGSNQFTINLSGLGSGMYQIAGYTADGVSKMIRFIKQ